MLIPNFSGVTAIAAGEDFSLALQTNGTVWVWGANYFGFVLADDVSEKDVYDFLRKALMQEYDDTIPVRGPAKFSDGEWGYQFSANGGLENFAGQEEILLNGKVVYRCLIHGGFVR